MRKKTHTHITVLLICVLLSLSWNALAQTDGDGWKLYYAIDDSSKYFYDAESIILRVKKTATPPTGRIVALPRNRTRKKVSKARIVKVRQKIVFANPEYELKESKMVSEFDCADKKVRLLMVTKSYRNGAQSIEGQTYPWRDVGLEPADKTLSEIVCPSR